MSVVMTTKENTMKSEVCVQVLSASVADSLSICFSATVPSLCSTVRVRLLLFESPEAHSENWLSLGFWLSLNI